jgi:hypothetical protein
VELGAAASAESDLEAGDAAARKLRRLINRKRAA